jgi:hypothetical protein
MMFDQPNLQVASAELAAKSEPRFAPAVVVDAARLAASGQEETAITVELAGGARVQIGVTAPAALVTATLRALQ